MTVAEVYDLLEANQNPRGIANWEKSGRPAGLTFGMGLTQLKQIAKQIGRDQALSLALWEEHHFDAKTLSTMIGEPKKITREQVERQVEELDSFNNWMISHAYVSNLLPKVSFLTDLVVEWTQEADYIRRRCGYLCIYQLVKNKKIPDEFFFPYLELIREQLSSEENFIKDAMNSALWAMGIRSTVLHARALPIAREIGTVEVDYGDNSCEAIHVVKHLTSPRIQVKFGIVS